ncbi:hypothetical protein [Rickettsiella endosymbiont of Dermanyssus gallinae]|uniref:hypothetical protein n=1 Tax=Rickettsiella endosymbiont of Dermanyssus gallinae TaxID=2856608 RepID=UPI001C533457|nr:hypothetical protein [Rickettsiella endosymbiont of Dermanyssus gallinae]
MTENVFDTFIRHCGTLNQAAKVLGISREHIGAMRRGVIHIHLKYALLIEKYMCEQVSRYAPEEFRPSCPRNSFA